MGKARAEIEITASDSRLAAGLNAARAKFMAFSGTIARGTGSAMKGAWAGMKSVVGKLSPGATARHAIGEVAGTMATRGIDSLTGAAEGVRDFDRKLMYLGLSLKKTPEGLRELGTGLRQISKDTGVSSAELIGASETYYNLTSDVEGLATSMHAFARISKATGASMTDITNTAAALQDSMGIKPEQMDSVFSGLVAGADMGKISVKDMGDEFTGMLPKFAKFGVTGRDGVMQLAAAYQVIAKDSGSASEAGTETIAMIGMLQARAKQLKANGVEVYEKGDDGVFRMRAMDKIVGDIRTKLTDVRKHGAIFGENKEGRGALDMLTKKWDLYNGIVAAGESATEVEERFNKVAESDSGKLDAALNRLKETIADVFSPERITRWSQTTADAINGAIGMWNDWRKTNEDKQADLVNFQGGRNATPQGMRDRANLLERDADKQKADFEGQGDMLGVLATSNEFKNKHKAAAALRQAADMKEGENRRKDVEIRKTTETYQTDQMFGARAQPTFAAPQTLAQGMGQSDAATRRGIMDAIRDGFAAMQPTMIKLGDNQVSKSASLATNARNTK